MKQEQHIHNKTTEEWGGDIGDAIVSGAITGLTTSLGVRGGEYLGNITGNALQSTLGNTLLSNSINTTINSSVLSYTSTIGNTMSSVALNGGSFSDILKSGTDTLTDKNIINNSIANGLTSGITVGLTDKLNLNNSTSFTERLAQNTISNITSNTIQSTIKGDSFTDSLKRQSINTLVMTGASYGANWIGEQYHNNNFGNNDILNKLTQLTLHAGLGAISNELMGNDGVSGAVSGVTGELFAELLSNSLYNTTNGNSLTEQQKTVLKEYGGFASGISSLIVGKIKDLDDEEIVNNIYGGYRLGKNAIENNYLMPNEKGELMKELNNCGNDNNCKKEVQERYEEISKPRDEEFENAYNDCKKNNNCDKLKELHYDLRMELTKKRE